MAFSQQDARFEPATVTLDDYSAADMMADLGIQRRVALPLAGRALIIPPPPPDINKHGPRLARLAEKNADAWGSLYDPTLAEERDDGLGEGQMHRTGPNYRPTEPRQRTPPRSLRHARSLFQLGKCPEKLPYPRASPHSSRTARRIIERRGRSRDRFEGPRGDILAPLRLESVLSNPRSRTPRGPVAIVRHHIAGNPPDVTRAVSVPSHISSRIVPDNPNVSHWNIGKLATARGGYDYLQSAPKKITIDPSPVQAREINKINRAAPVASLPTPANPSTIPNAPGLPRLTATRPAPPIPSGSVPFILPGQKVVATKLADVTNAGERRADTREGYTKEENKSVIKALELVRPTFVPDAVPPTIEPVPKPQASPASGMSSISDLPDKCARRPNVVAQYAPSVELDPEETEAYLSNASGPLNNVYVEDSASSTESESPELYSPPASGKNFEDAALELLHRDFYSLRKAVDNLKARITSIDDFENSLKGRIVKIRQLKKEVLNEIEREEKDMRNIRLEIHAMRMKHIRIVEGISAKTRKEEAVDANDEPSKLLAWNHELNSPTSVEAMNVESLVVDAESTVRVRQEKGAKRDMPMWIRETDNRASSSQSLEAKPEVQEKEKESFDAEITDSTLTAESTKTKNEQIEGHHIVYHTERDHQVTQTLQGQPTKENPKVVGEEPVEKEQKEDNEQLRVLGEAGMSEKYLEKGRIEPVEFVKKCAEAEEHFRNQVENEVLPKEKQAESELHQLAEILDPVHAEKTDLGQEKLKKVEHLGKQRAETEIEIDTIAKDVMEGTTKGTHLRDKEILNIQSYLNKDEQARETLQAAEALKQEPAEKLKEKEKPGERERERERERDESECLKHLRLEQAHVAQDEDKKGVKERKQIEKERPDEENLEQQRRERESHDKTRAEAYRLRLDEEKLVRDHLKLVKLQEQRRADEKARDEATLSEEPRLHGERRSAERTRRLEKEQLDNIELRGLGSDHEPFERFTDRVERVGMRRNEGGKSEEAAENEKLKDMRLNKATVEDCDSNDEKLVVKVVKQQKKFIDPKFVSTEPAPPPVTNAKGRVIFPYKIDLDLRPVFDYLPLRVKIQQFSKPEDAIIKDCKDLLTPSQFEELYKMPHFQDFLANCNERHSIKMARYYGNADNR